MLTLFYLAGVLGWGIAFSMTKNKSAYDTICITQSLTFLQQLRQPSLDFGFKILD